MTRVKEVRQQAFKLFVQYDIKANQCENLVSKLEYQVFKANSGIEDDTVRYHDNESFLSMWYDWYNEYERDIIEYARKLGFINERYPTTALEFDDTKYGLDIFYDYWIREGMNNYEFRINTKDSAGTFHRFMLFEEQAIKIGLVDRLDENGYTELEKLIQKCIDYLVNVVEEKIVQYHKLLEYVKDRRENASQSCKEYIYAKLEETNKQL